MDTAADQAQQVMTEEPPAKKQRNEKKEKSAEELAAAEAKRQAKQRAKEAERQRAKEAKAQERADLKQVQARAKEFEREMRELKRSIGDALKPAVQARSRGYSQTLLAEQFDALFANYERIKVTHTEESSRRGVSTKTYTKYSLTGFETGQLFGVTKTKGGSFNSFYGATTWCITSLEAVHDAGKMKLTWKLDDNACF
eukprot:TRINITY_DN67724_c0_g1_i1.p1 TRINITY_DN67724_c0_g1~~TRINITY_DN67724_c0_g1_i1.p1  ORF type:complete len:198 (+),score=53.06 TRINITY_DN67724_c0_g1_i1:104-697(+)